MMAMLEEVIAAHSATGKPPMRLVGQMGWVFSDPPGIEQLVAYEATVNDVLSRNKTPTVCVYDVTRLRGSMMMDLLRAHPLTVMNGVLHEKSVLHARAADAERDPEPPRRAAELTTTQATRLPRDRSLPPLSSSLAAGATANARLVSAGTSSFIAAPSFAGKPRATCASPYSSAATILRAARLANTET